MTFWFLVAQQLNTYFYVLCVCVYSVFNMKNLSGWISRIFKEREREISYQKLRTNRQQTNTQMLEIKYMSYTYESQLSTDKDYTYRVSQKKVYLFQTSISQAPNIAQKNFSTRNESMGILFQNHKSKIF